MIFRHWKKIPTGKKKGNQIPTTAGNSNWSSKMFRTFGVATILCVHFSRSIFFPVESWKCIRLIRSSWMWIFYFFREPEKEQKQNHFEAISLYPFWLESIDGCIETFDIYSIHLRISRFLCVKWPAFCVKWQNYWIDGVLNCWKSRYEHSRELEWIVHMFEFSCDAIVACFVWICAGQFVFPWPVPSFNARVCAAQRKNTNWRESRCYTWRIYVWIAKKIPANLIYNKNSWMKESDVCKSSKWFSDVLWIENIMRSKWWIMHATL